MKQALVIYSLVAGLKNRSRSEHIIMERLLALGYRVDLIYLDPDFEKEVENFDLPNISLVVAAGGDGTVKVAARTIITFKMKADLGIIPMGSANVIAAALNIPQKFDEALQVVEKYKKIVKIDVGVVNDEHYFLIGLSLGYISKVVTS
ncbi:MAG: diacylglycerol kinase family protein, partial [bacterium]